MGGGKLPLARVPCHDPHVRPTSILYGVDWWPPDEILASDKESQQNMEEDFDVLSAAKSTDIAKSHLEVLVQQNLSGGLILEVLVIIVSIIVIALLLWCKYQRVKMAIKTLIAYTLNLYPSVHPFLTLLKTCN